MLNPENEMQILQMDLKDTYNTFMTVCVKHPEARKKYFNRVIFGEDKSNPLHINYYIEELYIYKLKSQKVVVKGRGTTDINEFWQDRDNRLATMKECCLEYMSDDDMIRGHNED